MANRTSVLGTKVSGIVEYLKDNINGLFINPDPADIAEKISSLLKDTERRKAMGEAARKTAEGFALNKVSSPYLKIIQASAKQKDTGSC